ncbi:CDP-alcohol phosphatidyltransferase family protein [Candidatus Altiarchaeota archaeon]
MVLNKYRDEVDFLFEPVARRMPNTNPNILTLLAISFAFLGGLSIYFSNRSFLSAFLLISLSSYLDALDGKVAKLHGKATRRGDFLDHVGDRYADLFILLGIAFSTYCELWIGLLAIVGVLLTSYMGTQAQALGVGREYGGILGRSERLVILMATLLAHYLLSIDHMQIWGFTVFEYMMLWFAVAGNITALHRGTLVWRELK